jgi:hypothetical protein
MFSGSTSSPRPLYGNTGALDGIILTERTLAERRPSQPALATYNDQQFCGDLTKAVP